MGSTADDISTSSTSTVPPPSRGHLNDREQSRWSEHSHASSSMSPKGAGPSRPGRLHRPSALSLTDQGSGASSARILLGTSLPSGGSLKRRTDNWQALRDMMEDEEDVSDTETIRPDRPDRPGQRDRGPDGARKSTSIQSLRSLFTPRSSGTSQTGRSRPWSIAGMREDEEVMTSGLLSSSPPQMNGLANGIEETLDTVRENRTPTLKTRYLESDDGGSPNVQNGRDESRTLLQQSASTSKVEPKQKCQHQPFPLLLCYSRLWSSLPNS